MSNNNNNKKGNSNSKQPDAFSFIDQLLKSKKLEFVTAALLLAGELIVDSVELDRRGGVTVTLLGEFKSKEDNKKVQDLTSFLGRNKDMTLDDVFTAFKKHMDK